MRPHSPLVLLTNPIETSALARLEAYACVKVASDVSAATLTREAQEADVIIVRAPIPAAVFAAGERLRAVIRHGAGLDMIPVEQASQQAVAVANVPAVNARAVAEFVIGQMITLARRAPSIDAALRQQSWNHARSLANAGFELHGKAVAIVGIGAIGKALSTICASGFGMRVLGVPRATAARANDATALPLEEALPQADYLVLACPLTTDTRGLMDARRLALLKPGAFLINVARGPVLDQDALCDALQEGRLAGAALDVFSEQPLPLNARIRTFPQILLSPHAAGITVESMHRMSHGAVTQTLQILEGQLPTHHVNTDSTEQILARWASLPSLSPSSLPHA